jgi:hypothetical protein
MYKRGYQFVLLLVCKDERLQLAPSRLAAAAGCSSAARNCKQLLQEL